MLSLDDLVGGRLQAYHALRHHFAHPPGVARHGGEGNVLVDQPIHGQHAGVATGAVDNDGVLSHLVCSLVLAVVEGIRGRGAMLVSEGTQNPLRAGSRQFGLPGTHLRKGAGTVSTWRRGRWRLRPVRRRPIARLSFSSSSPAVRAMTELSRCGSPRRVESNPAPVDWIER
ncbi:hypothetical protein D9M72_340260 [compost metagenome]